MGTGARGSAAFSAAGTSCTGELWAPAAEVSVKGAADVGSWTATGLGGAGAASGGIGAPALGGAGAGISAGALACPGTPGKAPNLGFLVLEVDAAGAAGGGEPLGS